METFLTHATEVDLFPSSKSMKGCLALGWSTAYLRLPTDRAVLVAELLAKVSLFSD